MGEKTAQKYVCGKCGWEYDPRQGFPVFGVHSGTHWQDVPENFRCPVCGAGKDKFEPKT
jgi:rubredoxin